MSLNDKNFRDLFFVENLPYVASEKLSSAEADLINVGENSAWATMVNLLGTESNVNTFFNSLVVSSSFPRTWTAFHAKVRDEITALGLPNPLTADSSQGPLVEGFIQFYLDRTGIDLSGDWALFNATDEQINEQFRTFFTDWAAQFVVKTAAVGTEGSLHFFGEINAILTRTADIEDATFEPTGAENPDIQSYLSIATALGVSQADAEALLVAYYNFVVDETGYFVPSLAFENWVERIHLIATQGMAGLVVTTEEEERLLVIDRILRLVSAMIDTLHRVSISQSDRLRFLGQWQTAYTEMMNAIPIARSSDQPTKPGGAAWSTTPEIADFNVQAAQPALDKLRARRAVISDDAKALQAIVNQSTDAATQQPNLGSALLQQLNTILSAIFR